MTGDTTSNPALPDATRRAVMKALGAGAGVAATSGAATAHTYGEGDGSTSDGSHEHTDASQHDASDNVDLLDYHSLGDIGPSSESGDPDEPHYGAITELRVHGDYVYVGVFSAKSPTNGRGMAVIDVSEFNDADSTSELRDAELEVLSWLGNPDDLSAVMDVKVGDQGDYVFISKQPYSAIFDETDPKPGDSDDATSATASALQAVDVTDPTDPEVVGSYDVWDTGPHNAFHHAIDGTDYVFAIKDLGDGTAALYVFEFDRTTGALVLVNKWTKDGDIDDANVVGGGLTYIHDVTIQDDPRLDIPVGYVSYWDAGLWALDLSDPTSIKVLDQLNMARAHFSAPAPTLFDDTRVVLAGQETPSQSDGSTGLIKLVDADGLGDGGFEVLDSWEWQANVSFGDFTLSPHNFDITDDRWVHLGHYHGGTRFLRIHTHDWTLEQKGHFQAAKDVPEDSKMEKLNHAAPFTWTAVSQDGVVYASDINTGVYAMRFKPSTTSSAVAFAVAGAAGLGLASRFREEIEDTLTGLRTD